MAEVQGRSVGIDLSGAVIEDAYGAAYVPTDAECESVERRWDGSMMKPWVFRDHGEQPEEAPRSSIGACPFCERVPCEDGVHRLWRLRVSGEDV